MRLHISKSKNSSTFYIIKDVYINSKRTTIVVENLGSIEKVKKLAKGSDPILWAKQYAIDKTKKENENKLEDKIIDIKYRTNKLIAKDKINTYKAGYLVLQKIYSELNINKLCLDISKQYDFKYNLNDILSKLVYSRILNPSSKISTLKYSKNFLEKPSFSTHDMFRALKVLSDNSDNIEQYIYNSSSKVVDRNTDILYYDCTNYFFELEEPKGSRQYGVSKENRPLPIIQMGLFIDGSGFPLSFVLNDGNTNEQSTLKPLEKRILKDFNLSKFIVCTDAGLNSNANKKFNSINKREYISTYSLKKAKKYIIDWALDENGWSIANDKYSKKYNLDDIDINDDVILYKERYIIENGLEEKLIVSFSNKRKRYCNFIRQEQLNRAFKKANKSFDRKRQNDPSRFINKVSSTKDGEVACIDNYLIDFDKAHKESLFDGFYAISTSSSIPTDKIISINSNRWQIEQMFRLLKSEFKARPVFVSTEEAIKAHFLICFIALLIFKILEHKLDNRYSANQIIDVLKSMDLLDIKEGLTPCYTRNDLTDLIHYVMGFRTDYEFIDNKNLKKIIKKSKDKNITQKLSD